jgi:D-sedoheptulose 7-phosphate isomerase
MTVPEVHARVAAEIYDFSTQMSKLSEATASVAAAVITLVESLRNSRKVMFCGNGGSAADSQHLAAELMGRYMKDRAPLPALALTVDTSALTAIANDYSYADVFSRQLRGIGQSGDVLVGLSTSGNSANVVAAFEAAREMDIRTIAITGKGGGKMAGLAELCIMVPASRTDRIQEMHIAVGHIICGLVEDALC